MRGKLAQPLSVRLPPASCRCRSALTPTFVIVTAATKVSGGVCCAEPQNTVFRLHASHVMPQESCRSRAQCCPSRASQSRAGGEHLMRGERCAALCPLTAVRSSTGLVRKLSCTRLPRAGSERFLRVAVVTMCRPVGLSVAHCLDVIGQLNRARSWTLAG